MALHFKPHKITVERAQQPVRTGDKQVETPTFGPPSPPIPCHMYPEKAAELAAKIGIVYRSPHTILADPEHGNRFQVGDRVRCVAGGIQGVFFVQQEPTLWESGLPADNVEILVSLDPFVVA